MLTYSKLILFLKISFSVSAVIILAILFLISPPNEFGDSVKVSTLGLEKDITYQISKAKVKGSSDQGHFFNFTADSIDPDDSNSDYFSLTRLAGTISLDLTNIYTIFANKAVFRASDKLVELKGDLKIKTTSGITGKSEIIRIDFNSKEVTSSGFTKLQTPLGMISGGSMKISNSRSPSGQTTKIYFFNGVNMTVSPREL
mgnify:FL=1